MNVLIVDDNNDKVARIISEIRKVMVPHKVDVAVDFVGAILLLKSNRYHLLVMDVFLPIRQNDTPTKDVGINLLFEINRKNDIQSPHFIIAITQFQNECSDISDIWRTIQYEADSTSWSLPLINLIKHISKICIPIHNSDDDLPHIFVEGNTDASCLREAINLFAPDIEDSVIIKSSTNAGADWVARQIIAWAHSLKKRDGKYIKAIGILDGDVAGKAAKEEIHRVVKPGSVELQTFKIIKLSPDYARHIIGIRQRGLELPVCLEEMFGYDVWKTAEIKGWLEPRKDADRLLANPHKWNKYELSLKEYLNTLGIEDADKIYLNAVKEEHKETLVNYLRKHEANEKKVFFKNFTQLAQDIKSALG